MALSYFVSGLLLKKDCNLTIEMFRYMIKIEDCLTSDYFVLLRCVTEAVRFGAFKVLRRIHKFV